MNGTRGATAPWSATNPNGLKRRDAVPPTGPKRKVVDEPDWDLAACRGKDPEIFYPAPSDARKVGVALEICRPCTIREGCLAFAVGSCISDGVWDGESEDDRRQAKRRASRQRARVGESKVAE